MVANPILIDITLRLGSLLVDNRVLPEQIEPIVHSLDHAGITHVEVGHGIGFGAFERGYPALASDIDLLKKAHEKAPKLALGIYLSTVPDIVPSLEDALPYFSWGKIGIDYREIAKAAPFIKKLKDSGKKAFVQLLYIHHGKPEETWDAAKKSAEMGADAVFLTDSFGSMDEDQLPEFIGDLPTTLGIPLGFQARNHVGWALANSLKAFECGVTYFDASIYGMGPGAGITPLELLIDSLQNKNWCKEIRLSEVFHAARPLALDAFHRLPYPDALELLFFKHRMDFYPRDFLIHLARILDISLEELLLRIKNQRPSTTRIFRADLENFLAEENIKLEVVIEYLRTGRIPDLNL